ncbi:MAG: 2-polyprenyl-3-methyl-5-hydroxy-6-metoxy,4-benzoquinol methylase [Actinomycetia bacterium]|nr:2-polyprenyl-3-methyl-5-hydroxy-6-metoxy,4-benzoquinol methylase [Actinomycetes bacterium]
MATVVRERNDPRQYDDLAHEWWDPGGAFCALHWLAAARAALVPEAAAPGALLVDVGCGGGLTAPHLAGKGYRHIGVDIGAQAARIAREHGVVAVQADAHRLPIASGVADVVVAGEILEHVVDLDAVVAEVARILRPGGLLVIDTLADTRLCKLLMVTIAERARVAPYGIHDPALFVDPDRLVRLCATGGIALRVHGLRPALGQGLAWLAGRRVDVQMLRTRFTNVVYQGVGVKAGA